MVGSHLGSLGGHLVQRMIWGVSTVQGMQCNGRTRDRSEEKGQLYFSHAGWQRLRRAAIRSPGGAAAA